jgi:alpha-methylacyl-CoA racemase
VDGIAQPAPAPRFSRTVPEVRGAAPAPGADSEDVLRSFGFSEAEIDSLRESGAVVAG